MKISIFGTGYVGLVTGACLANLGHNVLCIDIDENKIIQLKNGVVPFYEPGLKELITKNMGRNRLFFSTDCQEGANFGEVIFNCVGTPSKEDGSAKLDYVFNVAKDVARYSQGYKLLINKSTVPPGTARKCQKTIIEINPNSEVEVASNPEFLKEGNAVHDFTHPDKIIIGVKSDKSAEIIKQVYAGLMRPYLKFLVTNWETSEMSKYANNSFLATKISFINEIANICDLVGADIKEVSQAIGMDYRISPKFLNAGTGYGGSCFPKDIKAICATAKEQGYRSKLLEEVHQLNERQKLVLLPKINFVYPDLKEKKLAIWGLSFKPKTDDIRDSCSLSVIKELLKSGAKINVYDPEAIDNIKEIFGEQINYFNSPEAAAKGTDGIILVTEWDEFRNINLKGIGETMLAKKMFDGRNIYNPDYVRGICFEYFGVGRK